MRLQVFEGFHPIHLGTGLDAVEDFCKRSKQKLAASENKNGANGAGHTGAQKVRNLSVSKGSEGLLLEHFLAGQEPEDAVQSRLVHLDVAGQVQGTLRAIFQQIGDSQLCRSVQGLVNDEAVRHIQ
jgi:hypothetical protein